jgi:hypothetical protein
MSAAPRLPWGAFEVIVQLLEYRVVPGHEAEVVGYLRHQALVAPPDLGLTCRYVGRRLGTHGREHLAVTVWSDPEALRHGVDEAGVPRFLAAKSELLGAKRSRQYRVVTSTGLGCEGARVLRLYRTSIAADAVETWERRTLEPIGHLSSKQGLLTVVAGVGTDRDGPTARVGEAGVVVLTAWAEWDLLLTATGGRLNSALIDTELDDVERPATADHYEVMAPEPGPG